MKNKGSGLTFSTDEELQKYYNTSYQLEKERFANIFGAVEEEKQEEVETPIENNDTNIGKLRAIDAKKCIEISKYKKVVVSLTTTTIVFLITTIFFALKFFKIF